MFKLIGRTSSAAHLRVFKDYVNTDAADLNAVRISLALDLRGAFEEAGINDSVPSDKASAIKEKILVLSSVVPDNIAKSMASQMLNTSHRSKKIMGITPAYYSNTFLAGLFQMMGQSPHIEEIRKIARSGRGSKDFGLFSDFLRELVRLFSGYEDMILTSSVEDSLPDFIKKM